MDSCTEKSKECISKQLRLKFEIQLFDKYIKKCDFA